MVTFVWALKCLTALGASCAFFTRTHEFHEVVVVQRFFFAGNDLVIRPTLPLLFLSIDLVLARELVCLRNNDCSHQMGYTVTRTFFQYFNQVLKSYKLQVSFLYCRLSGKLFDATSIVSCLSFLNGIFISVFLKKEEHNSKVIISTRNFQVL